MCAEQLARCWTRSCCRWPRCWTRRQMNLRAPQETRYSLTPSLIYWSYSKHPLLLSKLWSFLFFRPYSFSHTHTHSLFFFFNSGQIHNRCTTLAINFTPFRFPSWWHLARLLYARQEMSWWWMKAHRSFDSSSFFLALALSLWKLDSSSGPSPPLDSDLSQLVFVVFLAAAAVGHPAP